MGKGFQNRVLILMSTYNGEIFLRTQLASIVGQTYPNIDILIRDDGSTDSTLSIIKQANIKNLTLIEGDNVGLPLAFFELIKIAPNNYDFYALADQDDIWLPDKISYSIEILLSRKQLLPLVYSSDFLRIRNNLTVVTKRKYKFHHVLIENPASGCSIVFNYKAKAEISSYLPKHAIMHDFWIFWIGFFLGEWIYDPRKTMLYRYHASNMTAGRKKININYLYNSRIKMATEFFDIYAQRLDDKKKIIFIKHLMKNNFIRRMQKFLSRKYAFNSPIDTVRLKLAILRISEEKMSVK